MFPLLVILVLITFFISLGVVLSDYRAIVVCFVLVALIIVSSNKGTLIKTERSDLSEVNGIVVGTFDTEIVNVSELFPQFPVSTDLVLVRETFDGKVRFVNWGKHQKFRLETKEVPQVEEKEVGMIGSQGE